MSRLVTAAEMKACDDYTIETIGFPSLVLMEKAAIAAAEEIWNGKHDLNRCLIICGVGNNGGDGLAVARLLHLKGVNVTIVQLGDAQRMTEETAQQLAICRYYDIPVLASLTADSIRALKSATIVIDALFGIGLARPVEGTFAEVINLVNQLSAAVIAVDVPSGLSSDTGEVLGTAVQADATIVFAYNKIGLTLKAGPSHAGNVIIKDIGIHDQALRGKSGS